MSYRPICDLWILARAKLKPNPDGSKNSFYGSYLGGFPERARALLGCSIHESVLHVCGGKAKLYPYRRGFCANDKTLDLDPELSPDFLQDARLPFPQNQEMFWSGILIDPPYSVEDAAKYKVGASVYPSPNLLLKNAFAALPVGRRVGIIHYILPSPPKNSIFVAAVGVLCGFSNRIRVYSVFEKTEVGCGQKEKKK
jgi:hypothetical protein